MSLKKTLIMIESGVKKAEKEFARLQKLEAQARLAWTKAYRIFKKAAVDIAALKIHDTKREEHLKNIINGWDEKGAILTLKRDHCRREIAEKEKEISEKKIELAKIRTQIENAKNIDDSLVDQVFRLNDTVTAALMNRNDFLSANVYHRLIDEKGKLSTQLTINNSFGTKRVVALVNSIHIVDAHKAAEAKDLIQKFFDNLQANIEMDVTTRALYDLTQKLLVEKTSFKIGPTFYQFISLDINADIFPDLVMAQDLLKSSLRSEKTSSYIRLYTRLDRHSNWIPVKQS